MEHEEKRKPPGRGMWVICTLLILIPVGLYYLFLGAFNFYQPGSAALNEASARAFGCGLGTLFHLSCFIAGAFSDAIRAVTFRISEFFANLVVSVGFAFESYWDDMKSDGVVLLVVLIITGVCAGICIWGISDIIRILT